MKISFVSPLLSRHLNPMGARTQSAIARKGGAIIGISDVEITRDSSKGYKPALQQAHEGQGVGLEQVKAKGLGLFLLCVVKGAKLVCARAGISADVGKCRGLLWRDRESSHIRSRSIFLKCHNFGIHSRARHSLM